MLLQFNRRGPKEMSLEREASILGHNFAILGCVGIVGRGGAETFLITSRFSSAAFQTSPVVVRTVLRGFAKSNKVPSLLSLSTNGACKLAPGKISHR